VAETGWEQRVRAATLFYDLYRTDHALVVLRETRELLRQLAGAAEAMYRVGEGRQADVLRAQVEIARMEEEIVRMESMRTSQAAQLNALRDRPATEPVPPPTLPPGLDVTLPSADSLVALGLTARPALQAGAQDIIAATALERRAGREIWPDLQLGMIYGQRGMTEGTERMLSLMVGASVPIWAGRRQKQMRLEAGAMREMAEADLTGIQAETRGRVTELDAEIGRARRLLVLYRTTVIPQASATVTSATAAYRVGSVDFMTVLENQMTVNRYRLELLVLEGELGTALAELEMYTGQGWVVPAITLPRIQETEP
jgi:outer membrane protein TolC